MPFLFDANDVHTNQALSNFSVAYRNEDTIWRSIAPVVNVTKRSDFYYIFDKGTQFRTANDDTSPLSDANEISWKFSTANYSVKDHALGAYVPVETIENADDPLRPELRAVQNIRNTLENNHEVRVAAAVFNASAYPVGNKTTLSGGSQWNHENSSNPIAVLTDVIETAIIRPNQLTLGVEVWNELKKHPTVIAAIYPMGGNAATGGLLASETALAAVLGIERVVIGRRMVNTANVGQAPVFSRVWGKHALLSYTSSSPMREEVSLAYTFSESLTNPVREYDPKKGVKGAVYVKDGWNEDVRLVAPDVGYFFENAVL